MQEQRKIKKRKPRGRPFKPGQSGNPAGRPEGSLNKITLAVMEGARRAEVELSKPPMLDRRFPYEVWGERYVQFGRIFRKDTLLEKCPGVPVLPQPEMLNIRKPRQEVFWKNGFYYIQDGWLFDRHTWKAVKI